MNTTTREAAEAHTACTIRTLVSVCRATALAKGIPMGVAHRMTHAEYDWVCGQLSQLPTRADWLRAGEYGMGPQHYTQEIK